MDDKFVKWGGKTEEGRGRNATPFLSHISRRRYFAMTRAISRTLFE